MQGSRTFEVVVRRTGWTDPHRPLSRPDVMFVVMADEQREACTRALMEAEAGTHDVTTVVAVYERVSS